MRQKLAECQITHFSKNGNGLGLTTETQVEIPFTLPGDNVNALLSKKRKGMYQGRIESILTPSPLRIEPKCIHFASCGGCRWQNMSYENQLRQKDAFVRHYLAPHLNENVILHPIIPCDSPWQYRNKMEFSFSSDKSGNHYLGLILASSKGRVFEMKECHLVHPWFVDALKSVNQWWAQSTLQAYHPRSNAGSLRTLIMREGRRTGDKLIMLTVSGDPDYALNKFQLNTFVQSIRSSIEGNLSVFLRIQQVIKGIPTQFFEMHLYGPDHIRETLFVGNKTLHFKISPSAFFQPSTEQAEKLYQRGLEMIQIPPGAVVYDLYCGTGTLGICAASQAKEVIGIELSPESVLDAKENIKLNDLSNVQIIQGDVGKVLSTLSNKPDVVMVDPPRTGLDLKAIKYLLDIKAPKLLYISCNPITQSTNLGELIHGGYRLEAVQPVDQFPQTAHVENIAALTL